MMKRERCFIYWLTSGVWKSWCWMSMFVYSLLPSLWNVMKGNQMSLSPVLKHNHDPKNVMQFQDQQGIWSMHNPFSMWIKLKVFHFMHSLSQTLYKHMVNGFMTRAVHHRKQSKLVLSRAHGSSIYNLARSKSADSSISHCDSFHNDSKTSFTRLPSRILKRSWEVWVNI